MQKSKIFFIIAIICLLGSVFSLTLLGAQAASASQATNMTAPLNFTPQIGIPDSEFQANTEMPVGQYNANTKKMSSDLLPKYIEALYKYGLAIAGILAAIVLMGGGVLWLASGGGATQITKAKELMTGSIVGLIIIFCSWIILNTINPALLEFRPLSIDYTNNINFEQVYCCSLTEGGFNLNLKENNGKLYYVDGNKKGKEFNGCYKDFLAEECNNKSCYKYNGVYTCYNENDVCCTCKISNKSICSEGISKEACNILCEKMKNDFNGNNAIQMTVYQTSPPNSLYDCVDLEKNNQECQYDDNPGGSW